MNRGELADKCSWLSMKDDDFHSQCISNVKRLFSETVTQKSMVKYVFTEKDTRMHFLFILIQPDPPLPQILTQVKNIIRLQIYKRVLPQSCGNHLVCYTR